MTTSIKFDGEDSDAEALHFAAYYNRIEVVKMLLERGRSVNAVDEDQKTPLHYAIEGMEDTGEIKNYPEIIDVLLDHGADVNSRSDFGVSPLFNAIRIGDKELVQKLMDKSTVEAVDDGFTPLHYAVEINNQVMVEYFLNIGLDVNIVSEQSGTALQIALANRHFHIAEVLFDRGADIHAQCISAAYEGCTLLHVAVSVFRSRVNSVNRQHELKILSKLLDRGANVNAISTDGLTPFHIAVERDCTEVAEVLLQHGADVNALTNENKTALCVAAENGRLEIVRLIFKYRPDLNKGLHSDIVRLAVKGECIRPGTVKEILNYGFSVPEKVDNSDVFHGAVKKNCLALIRQLLERGFNVNKLHTLEDGETFMPLHFTVEEDTLLGAGLLIEHGADVNAENQDGQTPISCVKVVRKDGVQHPSYLMFEFLLKNHASTKNNPALLISAVKNYNFRLIQLLWEHNVDMDGEDEEGFTALHHAVFGYRRQPCNDIIKTLLKYGANVNVKTKSKISVLHAAALLDLQHDDILKSLLEHGADVNYTLDGISPLHLSALRGNTRFCRLLLEEGAQVNARTKSGMTPLHAFVSECVCSIDFSTFLNLLRRLYTLYIFPDDEFSKLNCTVSSDVAKVVNTLVDRGANVHAKDKSGRTALHYAAQNKAKGTTLIGTLVRRGAVLTERDISSRTAVHYAATASLLNLEALVSWGADINSKDIKGCTPMHYAAKNGLRDFILLIHLGADLKELNDCRTSPIEEGILAEVSVLLSEIKRKNITTLLNFNWRCQKLLKVLAPVKEHIVKIKAAFSLSSSENLPSFESPWNVACYDEYKRELAAMKIERVGNSHVSYYDVFTSSRNQLTRIAKDESLIDHLENTNLDEKFPHYAYELYLRLISLKQADTRIRLLDIGAEVFRSCISYNLPDLCIDLVLDYLSGDDLENLVRAYNPNVVIHRKHIPLLTEAYYQDRCVIAMSDDDDDDDDVESMSSDDE